MKQSFDANTDALCSDGICVWIDVEDLVSSGVQVGGGTET